MHRVSTCIASGAAFLFRKCPFSVAQVIRDLLAPDKFVIVVEHDLSGEHSFQMLLLLLLVCGMPLPLLAAATAAAAAVAFTASACGRLALLLLPLLLPPPPPAVLLVAAELALMLRVPLLLAAVLDYLSDFICCLYGKPGAYGEPSHDARRCCTTLREMGPMCVPLARPPASHPRHRLPGPPV